ncbi:MAG: hypothetical protein DCC55_10770 [Chloroflexi bacterium]|nr:MAG: hypothetical protein DCC55_10770 [Chloroflexota bacterium]
MGRITTGNQATNGPAQAKLSDQLIGHTVDNEAITVMEVAVCLRAVKGTQLVMLQDIDFWPIVVLHLIL